MILTWFFKKRKIICSNCEEPVKDEYLKDEETDEILCVECWMWNVECYLDRLALRIEKLENNYNKGG